MLNFNANIELITKDLIQKKYKEAKEALYTLKSEFEMVQKSHGKVERAVFDIDFDLKLYLSQLEESKPGVDQEELVQKILNLLPDVLSCVNKLNQLDKAKSNKVSSTTVSKTPHIKATNPPQTLAKVVKDIPKDEGLDRSAKVFQDQQAINQRYKLAKENLLKSQAEAQNAESVAKKDLEKLNEHSQKVMLLENELRGKLELDRQVRNKLAASLRLLGQTSNNRAQIEQLSNEYSASQEQVMAMNAELQYINESVSKSLALAENISDKGTEFVEVLAQVKQSKESFTDIANLMSFAKTQIQNILKLTSSNNQKAELLQQAALSEKNKLDAEADASQNAAKEVQEQLTEARKVLTDCKELAQDSHKIAEQMNVLVQEARSAEQAISTERAIAADAIRTAVQEAAEKQKKKFFNALLENEELKLDELHFN